MFGLLDDFLARAALAGFGLALIAGPLGCFVLWRRMAYFGEATAHSALLGVALGLALEAPVWLGALLVALAMAGTVSALTASGRQATDAMIGVFAHGALALGLVALSQMPGARIDPGRFLFGEILAVNRSDLVLIWGGAALVGGLLIWRWTDLLNATLSPDLARAEGGWPEREQLLLTVSVAVAIAISMQVVGLLLVTSLLILPAAAARPLAQSPVAMAMLASGIGALGVALGLWGSWEIDAPAGPSIVVAVFFLFGASSVVAALGPKLFAAFSKGATRS